MNPFDKISDTFNKIQTDLLSAGYLLSLLILFVGLYLFFTELYKFYKIQEIDKWIIISNGSIISDVFTESIYSYSTYSVLFYTNNIYQNYYRTLASFEYEYKGKKYKNTHYSYYQPWFDNPVDAKADNDIFKIGKPMDLIINPNNPNEAYIMNRKYDLYKTLLIGIFLTILGGYLTWRSFFSKQNNITQN